MCLQKMYTHRLSSMFIAYHNVFKPFQAISRMNSKLYRKFLWQNTVKVSKTLENKLHTSTYSVQGPILHDFQNL